MCIMLLPLLASYEHTALTYFWQFAYYFLNWKQNSSKRFYQIVSTQIRASPFERALFSALNRVLLIKLVLNLTLTGSQSNFVRNHVNIIPAPIKDIFEKGSRQNYHGALPFLLHYDKLQPSQRRRHCHNEVNCYVELSAFEWFAQQNYCLSEVHKPGFIINMFFRKEPL